MRWPIGLTWAGLLAERLTRAFWPLWSVAMLVLAGLMLGLQDRVATELVWAVAVVMALAVGFFVIHGARAFRWPRRAEALVRVDRALPGRPIQAMLDHQAIGSENAASRAVWAAHQARMRARAARARAVAPDLKVARRDPFGLRYMALLSLLVAGLFGSLWQVGSVAGMAPGSSATTAGPSWEGWVEPPGYTGLPVLYLNDFDAGPLRAPVGSRVTLRFYGAPGGLGLAETVSGRIGEIPPATDPAQEFTLAQSGELRIDGAGGRSWQVETIPDLPPEIEAAGPAETRAAGALTLPFQARDDYEVTGGTVTISLDMAALERRYGLAVAPEPRPAITVPLPLPVARGRNDFTEVLIEDFSQHPWANLPVTIALSAEDAGGNRGESPPQQTLLAARHFFDPMAAAVIEMRRDLLWSRENAPRVAQVLRAISHRPEGLFKHETSYLRLRVALRRLELLGRHDGLTPEARDEIAAALWDLALQLEDGTLADALERMRQAQERLSEAMKNGASEAEIARLMDELREATQDYMNQLQQQFAQEQGDGTDRPDQSARDENTMMMTQDDLQRMMDRIQELMEQGRMAEAQQALEEFQQMMENMRVTQGQGGEGQAPGQQAMEGLADTLRQQQGLSDQAFRDLQEQFNPGANAGQSQGNQGRSGGQGRGQSHDGQGQGRGEGTGDGESGAQGQPGQQGQQGQGDDTRSLAQRQDELRRELGQQSRNLPGAGTPGGDAARDALERAGRAMDGAEQALRQDDLAGAIDKQAEAMDALRDGMRNLGEAMAEAGRRNSGQQGQAADTKGQSSTDPLGRNARGAPGTETGMLQGEDVYRRARDLLDEIRRRSGETSRPETERGYLERLLDRF